MLAACAGPRMAQDFQAGKASFQSGDYKQAFRQLLPLAVDGKAEAQYAVGYMYYYGYGVSEDTESGLFWIKKSADQNYLPAVRALELIHHPTAASQSIIPSRQPSHYETRQEEIIRHEPSEEVLLNPPKAKVSFMEQKKEESPVPASPAPRKYALQLYGSFHLDAVKELQSQLRLKRSGHIYQTSHQGKDWYVLTFGNFGTSHEASATQHNLPSELKNMHPWVRNVNELQVV